MKNPSNRTNVIAYLKEVEANGLKPKVRQAERPLLQAGLPAREKNGLFNSANETFMNGNAHHSIFRSNQSKKFA